MFLTVEWQPCIVQVHRMNIDETRIPYENVGPQVGTSHGVLR